jgi:hypothetical protein
MLKGEDVLFVGLGRAVPQWYRCALPAYHLGARWIGLSDRPPRGEVATGNTMHTRLEAGAAKVFVLQQPRGPEWRAWIRQARRTGAVCLYEVDDYLPAVERLVSSSGAHIGMTAEILREYEETIIECDGAIVSTDFIGEAWMDRLGQRWWTCRNGIDTARFARGRAERDKPRVGWFGGGAHDEALALWAPAVTRFCNENGLAFVSAGQQYDCWSDIKDLIRIPFAALECVPDVLAGIDIGIAPWADNDFYRGKSDLRVLEGAAAGIAMLADHRGYAECAEGAWYTDPEGVEHWLGAMTAVYRDWAEDTPPVGTPAWRAQGPKARAWVERERDASVTSYDWEIPLGEVAKEIA